MATDWKTRPHRRFNPLLGEWVLVSPHRADRPWQGEVGDSTDTPALPYDPSCYLCPGNERAGGVRNPHYQSTFVFDNDFPALLPDTPSAHFDTGGLLSAESERGICRVMCFSPRHDLTIPGMSVDEIAKVVDGWVQQYQALSELPYVTHIQIFENRGKSMGASNPHPHCQIWANETVPDQIARESASQLEYNRSKGSCMLCDYAALERDSERSVCHNESFVALVPFWAVWPFEVLVLGKRHARSIDDLQPRERIDFADILKQITTRYDGVFKTPFPYSMGIHQKPVDGSPHHSWHMHAHYFPPLLRSATVRKFMVGYELLAGPQRDITPEMAAERLRNL